MRERLFVVYTVSIILMVLHGAHVCFLLHPCLYDACWFILLLKEHLRERDAHVCFI